MADIHDSPYSWFRLAVTLAIAAIGNVAQWAIILVMPAVEAEFGASRGDASLPYALTMIGFAAGNLLIGRWVDRYGVVAAQIAAALIGGAGFALAAFSPSLLALMGVQVVIGFASGACFGPLMADISHWFMRRRGIAVTVTASGNYLSGAIWPTVLSGLLAAEGWRMVYIALALITVFGIIPLALILRREAPEEAHALAGAAAAARAAGARIPPRQLTALLFVAGVGCCMAMAMPQVHLISYCVDLGFGSVAGAEMLSLMLLAGVASRIASGFVADWLGGVKTLLISSALQCVALFLYLPFDGLVSLYVVSMVFGLSQGGIVPSYAIIVREYLPPREAGARIGVVILATIIGMALGGWVSGWIYDFTHSYEAAFINGIAWNILNMAIIAYVFLRGRPVRAVPA